MNWEDWTWTVLLSRKHDFQTGTLKEKDYTFFWQGKHSDEPREHGVGFAVKNRLLRMIEPGSGGSERLQTLCLNSTTGPVTLVSVYAPTLSATPDTKDIQQEPSIHHQEHSQQGTSCSSGQLQCQRGRRSRLVALLPWSVRSGQNEWKRTATTGAVHLSWPVHYKLLLPHQASTQGFLEIPMLKALAPTGSDPAQACCYQKCSPHTLLPKCGLRYRPLLGVL